MLNIYSPNQVNTAHLILDNSGLVSLRQSLNTIADYKSNGLVTISVQDSEGTFYDLKIQLLNTLGKEQLKTQYIQNQEEDGEEDKTKTNTSFYFPAPWLGQEVMGMLPFNEDAYTYLPKE